MRVAIALLTCLAISCTSETDDDSGSNTSEASEDVITPNTGCSHIDYCDAPGGTGTICQQDACGESTARLECFSDLKKLNCHCHSPAIFITKDGVVEPLTCPPGV